MACMGSVCALLFAYTVGTYLFVWEQYCWYSCVWIYNSVCVCVGAVYAVVLTGRGCCGTCLCR